MNNIRIPFIDYSASDRNYLTINNTVSTSPISLFSSPTLSPTFSPVLQLNPIIKKGTLLNYPHNLVSLPSKYVTTPYVTSFNAVFDTPAVGTYRTLNFDPDTREQIVNDIRDKIFKKWIKNKNDFDDILKKMKGSTHEEKIYELKSILSRETIYDILDDFVNEMKVNWVELPHNYKYVRKYIVKKITKYLKK